MKHATICTWLDLSDEEWPPNHYRLLGLKAGEDDPRVIEENVQERMEWVRQYQLTHPELATEAMNRLAQAFVCLTDPHTKSQYDQQLYGAPLATPSQRSQESTALGVEREPQAWLSQAMQARQEAPSAIVEAAPIAIPAPDRDPPDLIEDEPEDEQDEELPPPSPPDPAVEAARTASAQKGLGTRRAFYYRLARTRALIRAWDALEPFLNEPERRLERPAEARKLIRLLTQARRELEHFPPLLGNAGQPGYLVVALARQQVVVPTFQTLLGSQRQALARDWRAGHKLLLAHKDFIRHELAAHRKRSWFGRRLRMVRAFLNDHPGGWLIVLGLLALAIALWRFFN